jgi:uncharacterized protein YbdZ (MbtH family)
LCVQCNPGKYSDEVGNKKVSKCKDCLVGFISDVPGVDKCENCSSTETSKNGSTFCTKCDAGQFMLNQVCTDCPAGWTSVYGETKCDECTQGKFVSDLVCGSCGAGTYGTPNLEAKNRSSAAVACEACPQGTYSSAQGLVNATDCNDCPPGKASDQIGNKKSNDCIECSPNTCVDLYPFSCSLFGCRLSLTYCCAK